MKKVTLILTLIVMTLSSFTRTTEVVKTSDNSKEVAVSILTAFQHSSADEYASLFPTLADFHKLMKANEGIYGPYSAEARAEFEIDYERYLLPKVKASFEGLMAEGKKRGIDWSKTKFVSISIDQLSSHQLITGKVTIVFTDDSKEYKLIIDKAFNIDGQWKVTQYLSLV